MKQFLPVISLLIAAGCSTSPPVDPDPRAAVFSFGQIETAANGRCYGTTRGPDSFQTLINQVEVLPENRTASGSLINPAIFRNEANRVRIPSEETLRFETICPPRYTEPFVFSLQRALAARGAYSGLINGQLDAETSRAIQLFQLDRGINSALLATATAQDLGLIVVPTSN